MPFPPALLRPLRRPSLLLALLGLVLAAAPARAEVALRALSPVMVSEGMRKAADPALRAALEEVAGGALAGALDARFPEAAAAGRTREESSRIQLELQDLLHLGLRLSRAQLRTIHFGEDRTDFQLSVTGTLFIVNLGTGEVLDARSVTSKTTSKKSGRVAAPPRDVVEALAEAGAKQLVGELAGRLAKDFRPGRIEARVADTHRGALVLARGYMDGAYNGEVFQLPSDDGKPPRTFQVFQTQEKLSLARPTSAGGLPKAGTVLARIGMTASAGNTPRLMVARAEGEGEAVRGVAPEDIDQWAEDLLADSGFVVLPSAGDLVRAQLAEAARVDVAEKALVGAQVQPDLLVVARMERATLTSSFDEKTSSDLMIAEVTASLSFVDVRSGAVLYGTDATEKRQDYVQEGGKQFDADDLFPGLAKDAVLAAAKKAAAGFKPRRASAKATAATPSRLSWSVQDIPFGVGTVAEVYRGAKEVKDGKGGSLGFVEELVGTARVVESDGKKEKAQPMVLATAAVPGLRLKAVAGTATSDARLVALGEVRLQSSPGSAVRVRVGDRERDHARTALYGSGAFQAVVDGDLARRLDTASSFLNSGAFAAGGDAVAEVKAASPTHRWDVEATVTVGALEKKGGKLARTLRADVAVSLVDAESGQPVTLKRPNGETMTRYTNYYLERTLSAREKKGVVAVGLADDDMPAAVEVLLLDAFREAASRTRKLADAGQSP
ncbi:hypothetical protein L6R50_13780 [Myxococcota bacterium]|nr:hypothetical protein [Myxococcota bacterium]